MRQSGMMVAGALALIAAPAFALPDYVASLADKACLSPDPFVQFAVIKTVQEQYPAYRDQIHSYWKQNCIAAPQQASAGAQNVPEKPRWPITGSLEAAADVQSGNTERSNFLLSGKLKYEVRRWRTTLEALARNDVEDSETTAEEYRALARSDYKLDKTRFLFAEMDYVKDRFSGYEYRLSETLGYGYIFYDLDDFYWEGRIGSGFRQDRLTDGESQNSILAKLASDVKWQFADNWDFSESAELSMAEETSIIESETALKTKLIGDLALKAAFYVEYISEVPPDTHDTDTRTTLGVVYDF